jgi:hypothetical protein
MSNAPKREELFLKPMESEDFRQTIPHGKDRNLGQLAADETSRKALFNYPMP